VSRDREDEHFRSPKAQLARAKLWSDDQGNRVVDAFEEIDVSGKLPLAKRPGLLSAIEIVEAGEADHIVVAYEPIIKDRALFERVQRRTVSRGRQAKSERLLARLGVLRCGTCGSRMVINSYSGNYRCGDTSANPCQRRAAVKADRVEEMVLDAVRGYSATTDVHGRASRRQQIREADEAIERASADLDDTIRQLGELGLLGRTASQETLEKLTKALDDAHTLRARLGDRGESDVIGPEDIDKLREPAKRLAAWRRLITDTVDSVTVAPAMTADGRPRRLWDLAASTSGSLARTHKKPPAEAPVGGSTSRVEHAGGGLGHDGPTPPRAEVRCSWLEGR
jgi:Recombinase zinc beta ribbon domain/Resolvase, N terminal domain